MYLLYLIQRELIERVHFLLNMYFDHYYYYVVDVRVTCALFELMIYTKELTVSNNITHHTNASGMWYSEEEEEKKRNKNFLSNIIVNIKCISSTRSFATVSSSSASFFSITFDSL